MTRLGQIFWTGAAINTLLLVILLVRTLQERAGQNDGSREMGLFFFIVLPGAALVLAMLLFHFSSAWPAKWIALCIVVAPGFYLAKLQIDDQRTGRQVAADQAGVGYFETDPLRQMAEAVVKRDVEALMRIGPTVDINAAGRDMTLMRLAVRGADARLSDGSELPVVRALLALGASADTAMHEASVRHDDSLLTMLLAAGGNPNLKTSGGQPLVFDVLGSITAANFRLLAAHGLVLDSMSYQCPLPVQLTIYRRWDLLVIAIEAGADTSRARPDGRTVASELASQFAEATRAGLEMPADLLHARTVLEAAQKQR